MGNKNNKALILSDIKTHLKFKTDKEFAEYLGVQSNTLSNWKKRNTLDYDTLITKCEFLNGNWLLTGEGKMLKEDAKPEDPEAEYKANLIPFYEDVESIGGQNVVANMNGITRSSDTIDAGDWFPGITAAIRHYNDSMAEYPSGCILALREINEIHSIVWGQNYVLETTEMRITKKLQKGDEKTYIMAYSTNKETYPDGRQMHEPLKIPLENVRRIYLVLGEIIKRHSSGPVFTN